MTSETVKIGSQVIDMADAKKWITAYFDEPANQIAKKPYAYPAYDQLNTGSDPNTLNDGDLLAPALLNAAPTIAAFYSLQRARGQVEDALSQVPVNLSLSHAMADGTGRALLGGLVQVLDEQELRGVRLTMLAKVLHRKRPAFFPLYDQFVKLCYVGTTASHPVPYRQMIDAVTYIGDLATAISADLDEQPRQFQQLCEVAPGVSALRLLDVLAWHAGRRASSD